MRLNRTSVWKVMTVLISRELPLFYFERLDILCAWIGHPSEYLWPFEFLESIRCSITNVSIYYAPESDICMKSYDYFNFSRASVIQSSVSRYIISLDHTFKSKVMAVWICWQLSYSISTVSIYDACQSNIRVKRYSHLNFSRDSIFQFWASRYIMGIDHTFESKVMAIWICRELPCSFSRVSIYDARESDIRVKSYSHLNFRELPLFNFQFLDL